MNGRQIVMALTTLLGVLGFGAVLLQFDPWWLAVLAMLPAAVVGAYATWDLGSRP